MLGYDLLYLTYFLGMALSVPKNRWIIGHVLWYPEMHMFTENDKRINTVTTCTVLVGSKSFKKKGAKWIFFVNQKAC